jgi:uncharacterized protein
MRNILLSAVLCGVLILSGCESKGEATETIETQAPQSRIVIDDAYVLLDDAKLMAKYRDYNNELLKNYDIDFRVITTSSEEDINTFANKAFATLQQESRSKSGKALLLVVNTMQDKVRLEVSTALEPIYTDAFVSYVERKGMVPYLREYKIADGIYMMTELVYDRAVEAAAGMEWMEPMESKSIGGGSKPKAHLGIADPDAKKGEAISAVNTDAPQEVMQRYLKALRTHNKNPNLDIYTDTTKAFFRKWTVTDINQDHEVQNISKCVNAYETLYDSSDAHAVLAVRPYDKHRTCSPYFFKKEKGKWKLDIATMAQTLRFNAQMQWHFDMKKRLEKEGKYYAYAFDGYGFDSNGYPFTPSKQHPDWQKYRWKYSCNGYYHPGDKKEDMKCWIKIAMPGGPANVRLGLKGYDKIYGVGEGTSRKMNVTIDELIDYLNSVPSGEVATVIIEHYYLNGKETNNFDAILDPNVEVRYETRQGIAP